MFEWDEFAGKFDRIISVEMFEHMKNYEALLRKISGWLNPAGKLFLHIFTHRWKSYHFKQDWMGRTFFTGGTMPSHSLLLNFQVGLQCSAEHRISALLLKYKQMLVIFTEHTRETWC